MGHGVPTHVDYTIVTDGGECVTRAEAKKHCRVTHSDDDEYIDELIKAARQWAEVYTSRKFVNTTIDLEIDDFPSTDLPIRLPWSPLVSITSVTYVDINGTTQTMTASLYEADTAQEPGEVRPVYGEVWPNTRGQRDSVTIRYVSGYGSAASSVPASIKQAIKIIVGQLYTHREPIVTGTIATKIPMTAEWLLGPYRLLGASS